MKQLKLKKISASIACLAISTSLLAQNEKIEEIVVTAVPSAGVTKLEASISVSSIKSEDIYKIAPRSVAEIFRSIPGVRSESSGGGGNANITIRGIPLATGGSKYLQLHEDGLPVLEFGDINFANTDNFIRHDWSIGRIESVRGGSASTFASNSPGGIINIISKTGEEEGGAIGLSFGLDYDEFRTDFEYGGALTDTINYHIGGFFRDGEGVRETGFNGDSGGQVKFNITKNFDDGFFRFYGKLLDDQVTTYLPSPVLVESNGSFGPVAGFDASNQAVQSQATNNITEFDAFGNGRSRSVSDGIESKVTAFGFEFDKEVADGLTINNKFRTSSVQGGFISPFTDGFAGGTASIGDKGASLCADASADGVALDCSDVQASINGNQVTGAGLNQLSFTNLQFATTFNDVGLTSNDFKITKSFDNLNATFGYYYSKQNINISWDNWQTRLQTLDGVNSQNITYIAAGAGLDANGNAVDVTLADNGLVTPSFLAWAWDLEYTTSAPYINVGYSFNERFSIDASVRFDSIEARGFRLDRCCGGNVSTDINGNGSVGQIATAVTTNNDGSTQTVITRLDSDAILENVAGTSAGFISGGVTELNESNSNRTNVNYDADNVAFSIGGSFLLTDYSSVFARYSDGGRAVADRLTQIAGSLNPDGSLTSTTDGYDNVGQFEVGYKHFGDNWNLFATYFNTAVEETNAEITSGLTFVRDYSANGLEIEGDVQFGNNFHLGGNITWTDVEISADAFNPALVGNTPRRQADFIWTITPEYRQDNFSVGLVLQGSTDYFLQDNNDLQQDAYTLVHLFGTWHVSEQFSASININNLGDSFVLTESEEGSAAVGDFIRARPLSGRSANLALRYNF